jgi:hypothetical protein
VLIYNGAFRGKKLGVMTYYAAFPPGNFGATTPQAPVVAAPASAFEAPAASQDVPLSMRPAAGADALIGSRGFPVAAAVVAAAALVASLVV